MTMMCRTTGSSSLVLRSCGSSERVIHELGNVEQGSFAFIHVCGRRTAFLNQAFDKIGGAVEGPGGAYPNLLHRLDSRVLSGLKLDREQRLVSCATFVFRMRLQQDLDVGDAAKCDGERVNRSWLKETRIRRGEGGDWMVDQLPSEAR